MDNNAFDIICIFIVWIFCFFGLPVLPDIEKMLLKFQTMLCVYFPLYFCQIFSHVYKSFKRAYTINIVIAPSELDPFNIIKKKFSTVFQSLMLL